MLNSIAYIRPGIVPGSKKKPNKSRNKRDLVRILEFVSDKTQVEMDVILSDQQTRDVVFARQIFCYIMATETAVSLVEIGKFLHYKDHTTVIYGRNQVKKALTVKNDSLKALYNKVKGITE